jgi:hypothetical protein
MHKFFSAAVAVAIFTAWTGAARAQEGSPNEWVAGNDDWANPANWSVFDLPQGDPFEEHAIISNGGVATVSSVIAQEPGQVILGYQVGETGSLVIANGGQLTTVDIVNTSGEVNVGYNGTGFLTVQPGGRLDVDTNLHLAGESGSTAVFGGTTAGTTTVNVGFTAFLGRNARVIGPNVNFSASRVELQGGNTLTAQITGATHSPLKSANPATLGGALRLEFNGVTPTLGNSWSIVDAPAFIGQFASVDASAAPALPFGQVYEVNTSASPSSVNGMLASVSVVQKLVLTVNRQTGAVSIATGTGNVSIDGYSIRSAHGALNPANWNSLQDQALSDWRESPQNGSATAFTELKPTGSTTFTQATPRALGTPFRYPAATEFGTEWEDLQFEYYTPDGKVTQGIINYVGTKRHNNLVLVVDPATGNAQIHNQSNLSVSIDGYQITSGSGSLQPANGKWLSLDDNNRLGGDWRESNPTVNQLVELKAAGSSTLSNGDLLDMGQLFKTVASGGSQDLMFEYLVAGESAFRQGFVVYGALTQPSLAADFNDDNTVNGLDLAIWKTSFGVNANGDADGDNDTDGADFLTWQRQFGSSLASATAAAVPEPASMATALAAVLPLVAGARSFRRRGLA